jgi:stage II sporulation protein AA (anti-sigma F factor antagonist)
MTIHTEKIEQGELLRLQGRFDTLAAPEFEQQIMATIEAGAGVLIIDCEQLDYMSSSILRVFLLALKTIRRRNGKIVLTNLQEHIKEVFDISGFLDLFEVFSTREDALDAI